MFKKIAIKIGSNVLANEDGSLHKDRIAKIVKQVIELKKQGIEIILISSGAVAAGKQIAGARQTNAPTTSDKDRRQCRQ